jgi:hypothetical protein
MIIAKLSPWAIALRSAGVVALLAGCWYWAFHPSGNTAKDMAMWGFALILTPPLLWIEWVTLRQMIFHQARAVWIEDDRLKFIDDISLRDHFRSVAATDIRELALQPEYMPRIPWGLPCVRVRMKDGGYGGSILTLYLTDTAEVVRARLAEALGLPTQTNV